MSTTPGFHTLVAVKRVIDYAVKIRVLPTQPFIAKGSTVKHSMNPFDEIAVEAALRLKEASKGVAHQVTAVTCAAPPGTVTHETLRTALAMGADKAICVVSGETPAETTADSEPQPLLVAKLLAAVVARDKPQLVIVGKQAIDDDAGQVGPMLAGLLKWPQATFISELALSDDQKSVQVTREIDGGLETVKLPLPCVLTTDLRLNQPRYATLPNIMKAKKKPLETLTAKALNVSDTRPRLETLSITEPKARAAGIKVDSVDTLLQRLRDEAKFMDEVRSGKFAIYGQWFGLLSILFLATMPFVNLLNISLLPFNILTWLFAVIVILFELPFCQRCLTPGGKMDSFMKWASKPGIRALMYLAMAVIIWLSCTIGASILILPALLLSLSGLCYTIALMKSEEPAQSQFVSGVGQSAAQQAAQTAMRI